MPDYSLIAKALGVFITTAGPAILLEYNHRRENHNLYSIKERARPSRRTQLSR